MQITQDEIPLYLQVSSEKSLELFEKTCNLKGFSEENGVFSVKLSDLIEIQYLYCEEDVQYGLAAKIVGQVSEFGNITAQKIWESPFDISEVLSDNTFCPSCGSKRFEADCAKCCSRYNLPPTAFRIQIVGKEKYKLWHLGYGLQIMPRNKQGAEFQLVRVRMDGYENSDYVYLKNIKVIEND